MDWEHGRPAAFLFPSGGTEAEGASNNGWTQDYVYDAYDPGGQYVLEPWGNVSGGYNAFELVGLGSRHIALYNENNPRGTYYVHPNALGSDSNWTDSHGQTTGEQIYSPWGQKLVAGGYVDRFASLSHRDQTGFGRHPGARLQLLGESLGNTRRRRRDTG